MSKDDGGPAFPSLPRASHGALINAHRGMKLRDYFAAAALHLITPEGMQMLEIREHSDDKSVRKMSNAQYAAMNAYAIADAMLAERAKK